VPKTAVEPAGTTATSAWTDTADAEDWSIILQKGLLDFALWQQPALEFMWPMEQGDTEAALAAPTLGHRAQGVRATKIPAAKTTR
jgi:hypothetical protein